MHSVGEFQRGGERGRGEGEGEDDAPFTPTELRDLVHSLRFRRGLPPAAAMYLLSRMESPSAALVRRQILQEYRAAAADAASSLDPGSSRLERSQPALGAGRGRGRDGERSPIGGGHAGLGLRFAARASGGGGTSRAGTLVAPVPRRRDAPPGAELVPVAPLGLPLMLPPPPPRGFPFGSAGGVGAGGAVGGRGGSMRSPLPPSMPPPSSPFRRGREGSAEEDLLTPARRARLDAQHRGRER